MLPFDKDTPKWALYLYAALMFAAALAFFASGIRMALAQSPPAQVQGAQVRAPEIAMPTDQPYDQLDADLHALVNGINARLSAVTDDMNQLRDRLNAIRPKPMPAVPEGLGDQSTGLPAPPPQKNAPQSEQKPPG